VNWLTGKLANWQTKMFIFYDLIFLIVAIIHLPVYLFRGKFHRGFLSRLGFLPVDLKLERPIWIHAVSVGEAMAVSRLVEELRQAYPGKNFVISTVTPTGNKIARKIAARGDLVTYLPLDFGFIVKRVIGRIRPALFIIAETEIWPNLISCLSRQNIPVAIVNARISDSSFKGYLLAGFLLKPVFKKIGLFCVQSSNDAQRLMRLGVAQERIRVTGNMKFDAALRKIDSDTVKYRQDLRLNSSDSLLVCGSTHPGEEEIILEVYKQLYKDFPRIRLLIAPRHPERALDIEKIVIKYGFMPCRISKLNGQTGQLPARPAGGPAGRQERANGQTVFILDTIGHLISFYAIADIVFVGGSLVKKGGQNILEPACLGKPVLFGPYMFNFRDIAGLFLSNQAAISVHTPQELKARIKELLVNPRQAEELGRKAKQLIINNTGATKRNLELIKELAIKIGDGSIFSECRLNKNRGRFYFFGVSPK
jgi:3-deoxy-D-manno-octulosonic-acid transferase